MANEQLSGRDLDAEIAERVMGWKRMTEGEIYPNTFDDVYPNAVRAGFDRTRISDWWHDPLQRNEKNEAEAIILAEDPADEDDLVINALFKRFAPSSDIQTAMQVVEKMRERGVWTQIQTFLHTTQVRVEMGVPSSETQEWGATATEAICKCALKAVDKFELVSLNGGEK